MFPQPRCHASRRRRRVGARLNEVLQLRLVRHCNHPLGILGLRQADAHTSPMTARLVIPSTLYLSYTLRVQLELTVNGLHITHRSNTVPRAIPQEDHGWDGRYIT